MAQKQEDELNLQMYIMNKISQTYMMNYLEILEILLKLICQL